MPYIGNDIRANEDYKIIDDISSGFNGSETSFALQVGGSAPVPFPKFEQQLLISVNGVIQEPDPSGSAGFRLSGTNIVFSSAPTNGHAFFGVIYAGADYLNAGGTFPSGTASVPSITFSSDTDTGIFTPSSGAVAITSNGTKVAQFPTGQGSSGQALVTDGAGVLSFATPTGTTASSITVADESSDTTCFPIFTTGATGNLAPKSGSNLAFNSSSGLLTATSFSGSGASLTSLNGSNISSGTVAAARVATLNQDTTGTAAIATTITVADESSDTTCFPLFATGATGNLGPKSGSNLTFNSSSGALTATSFVGNLTGDVTGNVSGSSSSCSGTAGIATTITVADESSDTSCNVLYTTQATGNLGAKSGTNLTFNSSNGTLTATAFSGNGASVTNVNAATVDSLDSSQFARSDTADTLSGLMTFTGGASFGADARCAAGISTLSDGANIQVDFTSGIHHTVTLGGNRNFSDPNNTGSAIGQSGSIFIVQDGTGSRTLSFHADYNFPGGTAPTLSTAANAVDRLDYVVRAINDVHCIVSLDVK